MNSIIFPCVWCVLQIALISALGVAISLVIHRRHPSLAACVIASAIATILTLTAILPLPFPRLALTHFAEQVSTEPAAVDQAAMHAIGTRSNQPDDGRTAFVGLREIMSAVLDATSHGDASNHATHTVALAFEIVAAGTILIGIAKFLVALKYARSLRRQSERVFDRGARHMLMKLARQLSIETPIAIIESKEIASAAVIGWRRPVIVFPSNWRSWTNDQLLVVLAHELAHIKRGDFVWRLLAGLTCALHFYQPLIHWLANQLMLSQELAADQLAVAAIGNREKYLKAMSQLAMSQDDASWLRSESIVLPALSTNLIRRITMLRAKDCRREKHPPIGLRALASGLVVVVGTATLVLRSYAEPAQPEADTTREERATQNIAGVEKPSIHDLFQRRPIDIAFLIEHESGAFAIRVAELYERPAFQPLFLAIDKAASQSLQQFLQLDSAPDFHFESIDYIAGSFQMIVKPLSVPDKSGAQNAIMFGSTEALIRFRDDVQWKQWIHRNFPKAEEKTADGLTYFEFSLPAVGQSSSFVAARDGRTIVWSMSLKHLRDMASKTIEHQTSPSFASEWKAADGGVFTLVTIDKRIEPQKTSTADPAELAGRELLKNTRCYSLGMDVQDKTDAFAWKCTLNCGLRSTAESVRDALDKTLFPKVISELADAMKSAPPSDGFMAEYVQLLSTLIENQSMKVVERSDASFAVEIDSEATLPLKNLSVALGAKPDQAVAK